MLIQLSTGVSLEASLEAPTGSHGAQENKLAVLLHPWSWLGGCMKDPVLHCVALPLLERNYHVLRFNSRGVGSSTGWGSFTGESEGKDLQALVQWGLEKVPDVCSVVIAGYSHGSLIASLQPILPLPIKTSHILLSYPLSTRGLLTLFRTSTYALSLKNLIQNPASNTLVIYGTRDEFTGEGAYEGWVKTLKKEAEGESKGRLEVVKVDEATHFWGGKHGIELRYAVERWLL